MSNFGAFSHSCVLVEADFVDVSERSLSVLAEVDAADEGDEGEGGKDAYSVDSTSVLTGVFGVGAEMCLLYQGADVEIVTAALSADASTPVYIYIFLNLLII